MPPMCLLEQRAAAWGNQQSPLLHKLELKTQTGTPTLSCFNHFLARHWFSMRSNYWGLCWFPHAAALCSSRHIGGMGGIKPTTEAPLPGEWRSDACPYCKVPHYYSPQGLALWQSLLLDL